MYTYILHEPRYILDRTTDIKYHKNHEDYNMDITR